MTKNCDFLLKYSSYFITGLVLTIVIYVRLRLLTVPLERDEGEYAYMGQLLLRGIPPFSHAYTMKLPGVSIIYALFMFLFGQTPAGIHAGLLIVNSICICLVYLLAKRLFDSTSALFSCASYAVMSLSNSVYGVFAHATHFVLLFALAGFLLLLSFIENRRTLLLSLSGLFFGLAFTMKQHAAVFVIFAVVYFLWRTWRKPSSNKKTCMVEIVLFMVGIIIPYVLIVLWMLKTGSFTDFWFWTVQYARQYAQTPPLASGWGHFTGTWGEILKSQFPLWVLAGCGCLFVLLKKRCCADPLFILGFLLLSFVAICPGWFFRGHYFILLLPAVALLAGAGICSFGLLFASETSARFRQFVPVVLLTGALTYNLYHEKDSFFIHTPLEVSRASFGANPFQEAQQIGRYLKDNTSPGDKIAVLGSEPEIYFYADRLSATGHIYMYGLMENQPYAERMQMQMIREIETARPMYIVVANIETSWMAQDSSLTTVLGWGDRYVQNFYDLVGIIDIIDPRTTAYIWEREAAGYTPRAETFMRVFKRKG